jgi:hypothetical protein
MIPYSPEYFAARDAALRIATAGFEGLDAMEPKLPCGHAYGLHKSAMLTTDYRVRLRRGIVDVTPQEVIDCMIQAKIKNWCLMGLHGYVGYLPMPRATQDVDVMVPYSQRKRAADAIAARWPMLTRVELPQVIRFMDSTDLDPDGNAKPVVDVMNPWSPFQETILQTHVLTDEKTGSRYPTVEAALASKYAALVSPNRSREKKEQDAVDFRKIVRASHQLVNRDLLHGLGNQIWEKGGDEVLKFIELTLTDQALPI